MDPLYPHTEADVKAALEKLEDQLFKKRRDIGEDGQPQPKVLVLAGAQGSGKTYLLEKTLLPSGRFDNHVRLYLPEFRELHPHYEQMKGQGVLHVYEHTEAFIWDLGREVHAYAMTHKFNIIMETALDSPDFAKFPPAAVAAGYRLELHVIASPKEFSHWSTLDRGVRSVADNAFERFVSLVQIDNAQANARVILDAFEEACTQVPGSEIVMYQRNLEAGRQVRPLCHSVCERYGELVPRSSYKEQPFVEAPRLNPKFEIWRNAQKNFPCTYLQYAQVVNAGFVEDDTRAEMVKACCQTLEKAQALMPRLPVNVFRDLSLYVLKYVHP